MKPIDKSFKVFNVDGTKNEKVMRFISLKLEINRHMKKINATVTDLYSTDIFLEYDQLVNVMS